MDLLRETEKEMQELVAFWRNCGLVTEQRTLPLPWWLLSWSRNPEARAPVLWPPYLNKMLGAIETEFSFFTDEGQKL
jgi:hypothetical protein